MWLVLLPLLRTRRREKRRVTGAGRGMTFIQDSRSLHDDDDHLPTATSPPFFSAISTVLVAVVVHDTHAGCLPFVGQRTPHVPHLLVRPLCSERRFLGRFRASEGVFLLSGQ